MLGARCWLLSALLGAVLGSGCSKPAPESTSYELTGQILAVHPERQSLTIKHQDIPGYMPGMTMTFAVREPSMVAAREPGEMVTATLEVGETTSRLTALEVTGREPITAMPAELALAQGLVHQGDPLPPVTLVDQNGRERSLSEWRGGPLAITFTYTRCPIPEFCPRIDRQFAAAAAAIEADASLRGRAKLVTISFDPDFDTPAVMKTHARKVGANARLWTFATGARQEIELFAARFGVAVTREGDTAADVMHNLRTVIVGADGTVRAMHSGADWDVAALIEDLRAAR